MLSAPRPEPVAEPEEIFLPDRIQHFDQRALDDLVLQRGYTSSGYSNGFAVGTLANLA
jgi:hypothetical protein